MCGLRYASVVSRIPGLGGVAAVSVLPGAAEPCHSAPISKLVTGTGDCYGLPRLRAGRSVPIVVGRIAPDHAHTDLGLDDRGQSDSVRRNMLASGVSSGYITLTCGSMRRGCIS